MLIALPSPKLNTITIYDGQLHMDSEKNSSWRVQSVQIAFKTDRREWSLKDKDATSRLISNSTD